MQSNASDTLSINRSKAKPVPAQKERSEQHAEVLEQLFNLYADTFDHDGYGDIRIEFRILRRGQKEVIIHCGKQYRYVLDCNQALANQSPIKALLKRDLLA